MANPETQEMVAQLKDLVERDVLTDTEVDAAHDAVRRLEHPLRLLVFSTDVKHAIAMTNMMLGERTIPANQREVYAQFVHGDIPRARVVYRDGRKEKLLGPGVFGLFEDDPKRVRMTIDLPVLEKVSFMVIANQDSIALSNDVANIVNACDVVIWAGGGCTPELTDVWATVSESLQGHSYLIPRPGDDLEIWANVAPTMAEVFEVDARRAEAAKVRKDGIDKSAFKDAGGPQIVKAVKKEIDILNQSAIDACHVLLMRYADEVAAAKIEAPVPNETEGGDEQPLQLENPQLDPHLDGVQVDEERAQRVRRQIYTVPLGKVATKSRGLLY